MNASKKQHCYNDDEGNSCLSHIWSAQTMDICPVNIFLIISPQQVNNDSKTKRLTLCEKKIEIENNIMDQEQQKSVVRKQQVMIGVSF